MFLSALRSLREVSEKDAKILFLIQIIFTPSTIWFEQRKKRERLFLTPYFTYLKVGVGGKAGWV